MAALDGWRALSLGRRLWVVGGSVFVMLAVSPLLLWNEDPKDEVSTGNSVTTEIDSNPSVTEGSTTSESPTTTAPSSTTAAPTTTAPTSTTAASAPITAPPAPPTTVVTGPPEFRATVRGENQGYDYYAIFYGTTFGASGGFKVFANCLPGTLTVTVIDDGKIEPLPPLQHPLSLYVGVDDTHAVGSYLGDPGTVVWDFKSVADGTVITSPVKTRVRIWVSGPSNHDVRIKYDCRG